LGIEVTLMKKIAWLTLLAVVGTVAGVQASGAPEGSKPALPVERLIEQLGSRDYRLREEANRALVARGAAALPALRKARHHKDAEVRRRVEALLEPLEAALLVAPKRVNLVLNQRTIREAVAELSKLTGYKIELWPEPQFNGEREKQPHNFRFVDLPFWEALDEISAAGGLVLQQNYGIDHVRLQFQDERVPYVSHHGMFRVVAQGFSHNRNIQFGAIGRPGPAAVQRNDVMNFTFTIAAEPRLPLLGVGAVKITEAIDDQKNSMILSADRQAMFGPVYYGYNRSYSQQGQANLAGPGRDARTLKTLQGFIPVTLLLEQKPHIVVDDILSAKGKKVKIGKTEIVIDEVGKTPDNNYQLKMLVRESRKDGDNDYTWANSLQQRIELLDAKGNKYQSFGYGGSFGPSEVNGTFTFGQNGNVQLGPPAKLIYYDWITVQHNVPFEFKDLPLP
jgi:hypothetical protein